MLTYIPRLDLIPRGLGDWQRKLFWTFRVIMCRSVEAGDRRRVVDRWMVTLEIGSIQLGSWITRRVLKPPSCQLAWRTSSICCLQASAWRASRRGILPRRSISMISIQWWTSWGKGDRWLTLLAVARECHVFPISNFIFVSCEWCRWR